MVARRKKKPARRKARQRRRKPAPHTRENALAAATEGLRDPLDYCPGCQQTLPVEAWAYGKGEQPRATGAFLCRECRQQKRRPKEEYLPAISGRARRMLRDLIQSRSILEVARKHKVSEEHVRRMLRGRSDRHDVRGEELRRAWNEMLVQEGLDLLTLARLARVSLHALEPKWNKRLERWDFFPNHMARIAVMRWLGRMLEVDNAHPGQFRNTPAGSAAVVVLDLGGSRGEAPPDAFTIEAERVEDSG